MLNAQEWVLCSLTHSSFDSIGKQWVSLVKPHLNHLWETRPSSVQLPWKRESQEQQHNSLTVSNSVNVLFMFHLLKRWQVLQRLHQLTNHNTEITWINTHNIQWLQSQSLTPELVLLTFKDHSLSHSHLNEYSSHSMTTVSVTHTWSSTPHIQGPQSQSLTPELVLVTFNDYSLSHSHLN